MHPLVAAFTVLRPHYHQNGGQQPEACRLAAVGLAALENQLESDRGRIINSAAVRRLQQKTQVFPLEHNAAVRSRLTHSLEVQQTGRFITRTVFQLLREQQADLELLALERATESLVEMACLMHDVGNPPFGHFGEAAISRWFSENLLRLQPFQQRLDAESARTLRAELLNELQQFEGNAQGIRLIHSLQQLNLTYLQAACALKYTRCATQPRPAAGEPLRYLQKKPGYYFTERRFVDHLWQQLGLQPGRRFALTYLMEAADDISYGLADIEDSVDKGILTHQQLADLLKGEFARQYPADPDGRHFDGQSFAELVDVALAKAAAEDFNQDHAFFVTLRVKLVHPLVRHAAQTFVEQLDAVCRGDLDRALLEDASPCDAAVQTLKQVAVDHVFNVSEVTTLLLQGHRVITGLLDFYRPLLLLSRDDFTALVRGEGRRKWLLETPLLDRLPNKHLKAYQRLCDEAETLGAGALPPDVWELYCRCRLLQDMVSGMTDQFALDEYQTLAALR